MAVEKGKVLTAIEAKLKGKSLSKNFKENIASKWAEKIDTDEDIDSYIEDREDVLLEASSEADRRATEAAQKAKSTQEPAKQEGGNQEPAKQAGAEPESEITKLTQLVTNLAQTVNTLQTQKQAESIQSKALSDERMKNIPKSYLKGRSLPAKEEELEEWVSTVVSDYSEFAKEVKLQSFGNDAPPAGKGAANTGKVDKDLVAFAAKKNELAKPKN